MADLGIKDPTIKTIHEFELYFGLAKTYVRDWHENIRNWRRWYDFDHYKKKPLPYEERYPDPTPTNVVDLAVGILLANPVEFKARGWSPSLEEQEDASRVEKFLQGAIYVNNEREEQDLQYELVTHLVRDGAACMYSVWDDNIAQDSFIEDQNTYGELPLRFQVIDPLQVYILPGGPKRWGHFFRVWEMTVWDAEQRYQKPIKAFNMISPRDKMSEKVLVKDYWRLIRKKVGKNSIVKVEHGLMIHDEVIWPIKEAEGYDDIPYTISFFKPVERDNPAKWHSILRPIETTITQLENAFNRRARQILVYSALPMISRTLPHRRVNLDPALGNIVPLGLEEGLEFPSWPGNAPDVENHIGFLRARLQQAGFTDVMFGEGQSQVSGFALSQLGDQNRIRLAQPTVHLERAWASWARKLLQLTSFFTEGERSIRVYGSLKGQDFVEQLETNDLQNFMVKANVKPEFPNERVRNHAMANQVRDILSERTIMENYLDIEQPDEERAKRQEDASLRHPAYVQFETLHLLMKTAQESDDPIEKAAAAMAVQMLQDQGLGGGAGGGGGPGASPSRENALGLASATGEATEQEEGNPPPGQSFGDTLQSLTEAAPGFTE